MMQLFAEIEMENGGVMRFALYPDRAPNTTANFCALAREGFFDGLTFHRVVKDYVIQGGAADNTCNCPCDFVIRGEFAQNGTDTGLDHRRGALSMARDDGFDTAGTQFFVVHQDAHKLDGRYAAFGMLTEGFDVLDRVAAVPTAPPEQENRPLTPQIIRSVRILPEDAVLPAPARLPAGQD